jgi:DsbC/DsbD-like thiol-disulfide interchange protein
MWVSFGVVLMAGLGATSVAASDDPYNPFAPSKTPGKGPSTAPGKSPSQQERTGEVQASDKVSVAVIPSSKQPTAGQTHYLGVRFNIAPQWHIYYPGQNATGVPPQISLKVTSIENPSAKITVGEPIYPAPKRYGEALELLDYVYEGSPVILYPVFVPDGVSGGVKVDWTVGYTVCNDVCLAGKAAGSLVWGGAASTSGAGPSDSAWSEADAELVKRAIVTQPSKDLEIFAKVQWYPGRVLSITRLGRPTQQVRRMTFFPHEDGLEMADGLKEGTTTFSTLTMKFVPRGGPNVRGILTIVSEDGVQSVAVDIPQPKEVKDGMPKSPVSPDREIPVPNVPVRIPLPGEPTKR